jgi:hypothetical protein
MSGSLQTKIYGGQRHTSTIVKKMGSYNGGALKKLGHYNGAVKRLGIYNGTGSSKSNLNMEIYPH